jgi:hypothetical protein
MSIQVFECVGQLGPVSDHSVVAVFAHGDAFGCRASHVMPLTVSIEAAAMLDRALDPVVSFAHLRVVFRFHCYTSLSTSINERSERTGRDSGCMGV